MKAVLMAVAAAALAGLPGAARASWYEASGRHFVVYSDDAPEKIAAYTRDLERFDKAVRVLRNLDDPAIGPESRLRVYVVRDLATVAELARNPTVAGFYIGRATGSIAVVPRRGTGTTERDYSANSVLLHEYTHHLMYSSWPDAAFPSWFSEGFAEFHSTAAFGEDGSITIGRPAMHRGYEVAQTLDVSIASLLTGKTVDVSAIYGKGWLLTHYLSFAADRKGQFTQYMTRLGTGDHPVKAATAFGDLGQLNRDLRAYSRQRSWQVWTVKPAALPIAPVTIRALTPGEAATMAMRVRSRVGVDTRMAHNVGRDIRRAAAPFPHDPGAQAALAEAELDDGAPDAAIAAADRALAADPKHVPALMIKAQALIAQAVKAKSTDPKVWAAARAPLLAANRIDTEAAGPLMLFYKSYIAAGQEPTANAADALLKAQQLAPFDDALRFAAARVLIARREGEAARRTLGPMTYNPHQPALSTTAAQIIAALDRKDFAAALALTEGKADPDEGKSPAAPSTSPAPRR